MTKPRFLQILAMLLLAVVLLAACTSASPGSSSNTSLEPIGTQSGNTPDPQSRAMGRYMESSVNLPSSGIARTKSYSGKVYGISSNGMTIYSSGDLDQWTTQETGLSNVQDANGEVRDFTIGSDGTLYIMYYTVSYGQTQEDISIKTHLVRCADGAATEIPLTFQDGTEYVDEEGNTYLELYPNYLDVLADGSFLIGSDYDGAFLLSADGVQVRSLSTSETYGYAVSGEEIALYIYDARLVRIFSTTTGEVLREIPVDSATVPTLLAYDSTGALYHVTSSGIYRAAPGGTLWECIVDGNLCSLSKPSNYLMSLLFSPDDEPLVLCYEADAQENCLYRYVFDATVPTEPDITLNVYSLYDSEYLRQCAALFQNRYPSTMVKINVALSGDNSITRDDAIRTLNMEVLGGKGPDLILLDGLPMQSYVEKGVLADLSGIVSPFADSNALYGNIVGTYQQGASLPAVPLRFNIPTLWGDVSAVKTLDDLIDWIDHNPDTMPFYDMTPEALIDRFYLTSSPAWYDERGLLKQDAVEAFLEALKTMHDKASSNGNEKIDINTNFSYSYDGGWNPYQGSIVGDTGDALGYAYGEVGFMTAVLRSANSMILPNGAVDQAGHGSFTLLPGQAQNVYFPSSVIGVNAKSSNLDLAKEFVKLALEMDLQKSDTQDGLPVNIEALTHQFSKEDGATSFGFSDGDSDRSLGSKWPDASMRQQLSSLIQSLKTPVNPDVRIHEILTEETKAYFQGEMNLSQAAGNVVSKANAYLSE